MIAIELEFWDFILVPNLTVMFQTLDQLCPATLSATSWLWLDGDEHCAEGCKALSKEGNDHCYPGTPICTDEGSHTWAHNQLWGGHGDHYKGNCFTLGVTSVGPGLPQEESRGLWNVMNRETRGYDDYRWGHWQKSTKNILFRSLDKNCWSDRSVPRRPVTKQRC